MTNFTKLLFGLLFFASLHACTDGLGDVLADDSLHGTWKAISFEAQVDADYVANGDTTAFSSSVVGDDLDYEVTFDATTFMTNGSYTVTYTLELNGQVFPPTTHTETGVSGDGTYTIEGDTLTIDGVLYELEINGIDFSALEGEQDAHYEINADGQLTVSQEAVIESNQSGVTGAATVSTVSVWVKK